MSITEIENEIQIGDPYTRTVLEDDRTGSIVKGRLESVDPETGTLRFNTEGMIFDYKLFHREGDDNPDLAYESLSRGIGWDAEAFVTPFNSKIVEIDLRRPEPSIAA